MPSGWRSLNASTCSGRNRWWTLAVALPEEEGGLLDVGLREPTELTAGIPNPHRALVVAHVVARVATQVLVGEEQHLLAALERPLQHRPGVRRRAHRSAVAADERLQRGGRVHVGDRHDAVEVGRLPRASHASSHGVESAMSAIEQPAFRSGAHALVTTGQHVGASAMKWTPQNTMSVACSFSAAKRASRNESPRLSPHLIPRRAGSGGRDQQAGAELGARRADPGVDSSGTRCVPVRQP